MTISTTRSEIRVLDAADADCFESIADETFDYPIVRERLQEFLRDPRHHLVAARADGVVVGFISAVHYVHPDKPHTELWINEVSVAPSQQRRGLARSMLDTLLAHARDLGCAEAWVLTDRSNEAALALYAACGGQPPSDQVMVEFRLDGARSNGHQAAQ